MGKKIVGLLLFVVNFIVTFFIARLLKLFVGYFVISPNDLNDDANIYIWLGLFQIVVWVGLMVLGDKLVRRYLYASKG
jgi:hypothetical protein